MVDRGSARGFVGDFNRTYEEKTELTHLCKVRGYEEDDAVLDFFQIGRRAAVPTGLVDTGRYRYVSDAAVGALCEGEKEFVVEGLDGVADGEGVRTVGVTERPIETQDVVKSPDTVLVPRNETGDTVVKRWEEDGRIQGLGNGRYVTVGSDEEDEDSGVWLHRHGGDDVFVLDSDKVTVVRKSESDTEPPGFAHVEGYEELCDESKLGVYFGDGTHADDGFVDVVYRVVVSAPVVQEGGACRLRT